MSEIPCTLCLKYPICVSKDELKCKDLTTWLWVDTGPANFSIRLIKFEKWWGREASVITQVSSMLYFKEKKDHHQCLIAKNM